MSVNTPHPIEVTLDSGLVLRGLEYSQDGPPVLMIHDLEGDADSWQGLPRLLMEKGFRAIVLELRGHGLSDGEIDDSTTINDIRQALAIIHGSFGPVALLSTGSVATTFFDFDEELAPVHLLISPLVRDDVDLEKSQTAMRAIFSGTKDTPSDDLVRNNYQQLRGKNMWFSTGSSERGVELLLANPSMIDQVIMFIRRYLVGNHLAWIAASQSDEDKKSPNQAADE